MSIELCSEFPVRAIDSGWVSNVGEWAAYIWNWLWTWPWDANYCNFNNPIEHLYHGAVLSLVISLGYLGLDRAGEEGHLGKMARIIDKEFKLRVESFKDFCKTNIGDDPDAFLNVNVGPNFQHDVYLILEYIGGYNITKAPKRWFSFAPKFPLGNYWLICKIIKKKKDWLPITFAAIAFFKFFLVSFVSIFTHIPENIMFFSLFIDVIVVAWIVWRVWSITKFPKTIGTIFLGVDTFHNAQLKKHLKGFK